MASTTTQTLADLYLRLSDFRHDDEGSFPAREAKLRAKAAGLGWAVHRVVVENDLKPDGGRKPASAWKRIYTGRTTENGRKIYRVERDGWRSIITDLETGAANAVLAEDLDRTCRDMADLLDLLDAIGACKGNARSLSGSLTLTDGGTSSERTTAKILVSVAEKSSDDTSRRVADGRERWAGRSYGGGRRPYGFRVTPDTEMYHRTLTVDESEATVLRDAAAAILGGISLKSAAAGLRDRGVPTVTGAAWSAETLKDALLKDAVTGLTDDQGRVVWPAIIERDTQDRLRDLLAADSREVTGRDGKTYRVARNTSANGNAPRWLVSLIAECGVCGGLVKCTGSSNRRAYTCRDHGHVRRNAAAVDEYVAAYAVERLESGAADLLRPPPRPGVNAAALRREARKLNGKRDDLARLLIEEVLTEAGVRAERKRIDARLAEIAGQLAASDQPDPLAEFRDRPAAAVWASLPLARKRAVVKLLMTVTILPATRRGAGFDPASVRVGPRTP
jgi:DNA invertase Pin-like site-specific DNA recombinase